MEYCLARKQYLKPIYIITEYILLGGGRNKKRSIVRWQSRLLHSTVSFYLLLFYLCVCVCCSTPGFGRNEWQHQQLHHGQWPGPHLPQRHHGEPCGATHKYTQTNTTLWWPREGLCMCLCERACKDSYLLSCCVDVCVRSKRWAWRNCVCHQSGKTTWSSCRRSSETWTPSHTAPTLRRSSPAF